MDDPVDFERFVTAQNPEFESILEELRAGRKRGHWMWYVFPQLRGLGKSWASNHYGISSSAEAQAYLKHAVLGQRLIECTKLVNSVQGRSANDIFGDIDSVKFRSSMTLFAKVEPSRDVFAQALEKYFAGQPDPTTLELLLKHSQAGAV